MNLIHRIESIVDVKPKKNIPFTTILIIEANGRNAHKFMKTLPK
jgi:hypothetical protein